MTQKDAVIRYIQENGSITTVEAFMDLGITRLASRIHDLTRDGYAFNRETTSAKNRYGETVHFTTYSLRD